MDDREDPASWPPVPGIAWHRDARDLDAALSLEHVTVGPAGLPGLDDVSFAVRRGTTVAITVSPDDCPSTALEAVLGLRPLDGGQIRVLGMDPGVAVATGRVGAALASSGLPDGVRVGELLRFLASLHDAPLPVADVLARTGLDRHRDLPANRLTRSGRRLLLLAAAIVGDPDLLLLEEPFAGLDTEACAVVRANLERFRDEGRTVLLTTGDPAVASSVADRVLRLRGGRLHDATEAPPARGAAVGRPLVPRDRVPPSSASWRPGALP
jgi:ABC-2 type transport system ATP-binding protein